MSVLTQGTHIFFIDPEFDSNGAGVRRIECATSFNPGGAPADQIDDTCLEDLDASSKRGLRRPGVATMGLNADPQNESHIRLYELFNGDEDVTLKFAIGWSDGTDIPGVDSSEDFNLPVTRTWFIFEGYISDFPFDFALNSVVSGTVSIQRSGGSQWLPKSV